MSVIDTEGLRIETWADRVFLNNLGEQEELLFLESEELPVPMANSPATGRALVSNGHLGADLIRLRAGTGFAPHTHPGDHILICVAGQGTITFNGRVYGTEAGQLYFIAGAVPHAVGARTNHSIIAIGSPHKAVDSPERMALVEYQAVLAKFDDLRCMICDLSARYPEHLHNRGCPHCPCAQCCEAE